MNCNDIQKIIDAHVDGELDVLRIIEIDQHIETCTSCSGIMKQRQLLRQAVRNASLSYDAPEDLRQSVRLIAHHNLPPVKVPYSFLWRILALAASFACVLLVIWRFIGTTGPSPGDTLADELLQSHVRSLMLNHLTDVPSTDQHTVKPWFNGKVDFSPRVKDLAKQDFPLIGGRLDYVGNQPVAALVFQRRKHIINLFTWPSPVKENSELSIRTQNGYNLVSWNEPGMAYWAVSDVSLDDLKEFVRLQQQ